MHSVKFLFPGLCGFLMGVFHLSAVSSDLYAHLFTNVISVGNVLLTVDNVFPFISFNYILSIF